MDRSQLEARYPLLRPITSEGAETFLARSGTGAVVMVHFLDAPLATWRGGLLMHPERLSAERRERILELLDVEGRGVAVTRFLLDFRSLPEWLGATEPTGAASYGATEEFQRLFEQAADPPPDALSDVPPYAPGAEIPAELTDDEPAAEEPGEFTRLFRAADASPGNEPPLPPQTPPTPPPAVSDRSASPAQAGEFTRMFQKLSGGGRGAEPTVRPEAPPTVPPTPSAPLYPPAEPAPTYTPPAATPPLPSVTDSDAYRDRLYRPSEPAVPPAEPPAEPARRTAVDPELPPLPAEMAPVSPPPSPAAGEYTRMVAAQPAPPVPTAPPPVASPSLAATPEPEQPPRRVGPLIGIAVVVLAALLLIAYLVVRSAGSGAPTDPGDEAPAAESM